MEGMGPMGVMPTWTSAPVFFALASAASVFSNERLYTEIGNPFSAMLRAKFCNTRNVEVDGVQMTHCMMIPTTEARRTCPITARPTRPTSDCAVILQANHWVLCCSGRPVRQQWLIERHRHRKERAPHADSTQPANAYSTEHCSQKETHT